MVSLVAFLLDSKLVALASYNKTVRLWDAVTGVALQMLKGYLDRVSLVAFLLNSKLVALALYNRTVRL